MGLKQKILATIKLLDEHAMAIIPYAAALGDGKLEVGLVKLQATHLLKVSINANIETPLPEMMLAAFMKRYRKKKYRDAKKLRDEGILGEVKDKWLLINSPFDIGKELEEFNRLSEEFEKAVLEEEETEFRYVVKPQLIEHYIDMLDEEEIAAGDIDSDHDTDHNFDADYSSGRKEKGGTVILSQENKMDMVLPGSHTEIVNKPQIKEEKGPRNIDPNQDTDHSFEAENSSGRKEKGATVILSQENKMDNYAQERGNLFEELEKRKAELKKWHYEEDMKLDKEFAEDLARLVEKYSRIS